MKLLLRFCRRGSNACGDGVRRKDWFAVGDYKKLPNEVGSNKTTAPEDVHVAVKTRLACYNKTNNCFTRSLSRVAFLFLI